MRLINLKFAIIITKETYTEKGTETMPYLIQLKKKILGILHEHQKVKSTCFSEWKVIFGIIHP